MSGIDNLDDLEFLSLEEQDQNEHYGADISGFTDVSDEERAWKSLDLDQQCKEVLTLLSENKR